MGKRKWSMVMLLCLLLTACTSGEGGNEIPTGSAEQKGMTESEEETKNEKDCKTVVCIIAGSVFIVC